MHSTSLHRLATGAAGLVLAISLTGCGSDDDQSAGAPETTPVAEETQAAPLPITDHVLGGDELPGFAADGAPEVQSLAAFAEAHEKPVAELRESGLRSGSTVFFEGEDFDGFALSVAAEYVDSGAADAEAERLFASNTEDDPSIEARPLEVPGVPDARAASLHGNDDGMELTGVEVVFVEGEVMHEVFAVGQASGFDLDAVLAAVAELHERVAGRPLP